jgi:hypothetical protein
MQRKTALIACVAALFIGACGGESIETEAPETLDSVEQSLIYPCPYSSSWVRTWYSTTTGAEVGYETCSCDGTLQKYGTTRGRYEQQQTGWCN